MSRIASTLLQLNHQFHIIYSGRGNEEFARHAAMGVAMSAALDDAKDPYGWVGDRKDLAEARKANPGMPPALAEGLRKLSAMSDMPYLADDYGEFAVESYWRQLGAVVDHRAQALGAAPAPRM